MRSHSFINYLPLLLIPPLQTFSFSVPCHVLFQAQTRNSWSAFSSDVPTNFSSSLLYKLWPYIDMSWVFQACLQHFVLPLRQRFIHSRFLPCVALCTKVCHWWMYFHCNYYTAVTSPFSCGCAFFMQPPTQQNRPCVTTRKNIYLGIHRLAQV